MGYFDDQEQAPAGALEQALLKRRQMLEAASKRNIGQFQQSWKGAAPSGMPPEMIRAQMLLAKLNGGGAPQQAMASIAPEPPNPLAGIAIKGGQIVNDPAGATRSNPMGRKAMGVSEASGGDSADRMGLQAQLADPAYVAARTAQSNAARAKATQPGFHRQTHNEIVAARQEARIQHMRRMQMMAIEPHLAVIAAQQGMTPQKAMEQNAYKAVIVHKLVEAGMPIEDAMKHPWVAGDQGQQAGAMGAPPGAPPPVNQGMPQSTEGILPRGAPPGAEPGLPPGVLGPGGRPIAPEPLVVGKKRKKTPADMPSGNSMKF